MYIHFIIIIIIKGLLSVFMNQLILWKLVLLKKNSFNLTKMAYSILTKFLSLSTAVTSARVTSVSECKPVFHRRAERNTHPTNKTDQSQETHTLQGPQETNEHTKTDGDTKPFVFTKTHEEFCFNFNLWFFAVTSTYRICAKMKMLSLITHPMSFQTRKSFVRLRNTV